MSDQTIDGQLAGRAAEYVQKVARLSSIDSGSKWSRRTAYLLMAAEFGLIAGALLPTQENANGDVSFGGWIIVLLSSLLGVAAILGLKQIFQRQGFFGKTFRFVVIVLVILASLKMLSSIGFIWAITKADSADKARYYSQTNSQIQQLLADAPEEGTGRPDPQAQAQQKQDWVTKVDDRLERLRASSFWPSFSPEDFLGREHYIAAWSWLSLAVLVTASASILLLAKADHLREEAQELAFLRNWLAKYQHFRQLKLEAADLGKTIGSETLEELQQAAKGEIIARYRQGLTTHEQILADLDVFHIEGELTDPLKQLSIETKLVAVNRDVLRERLAICHRSIDALMATTPNPRVHLVTE